MLIPGSITATLAHPTARGAIGAALTRKLSLGRERSQRTTVAGGTAGGDVGVAARREGRQLSLSESVSSHIRLHVWRLQGPTEPGTRLSSHSELAAEWSPGSYPSQASWKLPENPLGPTPQLLRQALASSPWT